MTGERGNQEQLLIGYRFLFCSEEDVLELDRGSDSDTVNVLNAAKLFTLKSFFS